MKTTFMKAHCILLITIFLTFSLSAQTISGVVNDYTALSASGNAGCSSFVTAASVTDFSVGDLVLVIQMQGAIISETDDANFGTITDGGSAGYFDRMEIDQIVGNDVYFTSGLTHLYDFTDGSVQMVRIFVGTNITVSGNITASPWDGTTGGVVAVEATGSITLNADIDVSEQGFRGGGVYPYGISCNAISNYGSFFYGTNGEGGGKGEGVTKFIAGKETGKGPQANGGGGGNDHNAGGGGGGNQSAGGDGGRNQEPSFFGCKGNHPGLGGYSINDTNRLIMGGGGGAGHRNNNVSGIGGDGGGIIYVSTPTLSGNGFSLISNGEDGGTVNGDGGGGGGGAGSIHLTVSTLTALNITSEGGNGGDTGNSSSNRCFGPGGGGAGGALFTAYSGGGLTISLSPGMNGVVTTSTNGCNGSSNGATQGQAGVQDNLPNLGSYSPHPIGFIR